MFVYDTGRVCVLSATRCGHTSMYEYFGLPVYSITGVGPKTWLSSSSKKIIILRHPLERVYSAQNMVNIKQMDELSFYRHSFPYLSAIPIHAEFYYIHFDDLCDYLPYSSMTVITKTRFSVEMDYITNKYYTKDDLENEISIYNTMLSSKPKITPEEWKELTS